MYFITKNKIADYIAQHLEAKTAFLTWIKEFPYSQGKSLFKDHKNQPIDYILNGWFDLGRGDYSVEFKFNPWLKIGYIVWLGAKAALVEHQEREFEKLKAKYPDSQRKVFTTTIRIEAPEFSEPSVNTEDGNLYESGESDETVSVGIPVDLTNVHLGNAPEIFPSKIEDHIVSEFDLQTKTEYENALDRAIALFESKPDTPEFGEPSLLLPLIWHYEATNIELPRLALLDVIKLKMEMFEMNPSHLTFIVGSDEEVSLFLTGKNTLSEKKLQAICDLLYILIPLNDKSLIK
ncbi:hypothetical protein SAMN05421821_106155 [Mucilaginibacter lappiensis]|uniref:Antitoxin component HigA of HigAB toxin-antitoxin module n=1 Tax=Mucilaginibacter lappiensis TaxID=354630 RepID=A0ABR6PKP7_9SPHI|nr:hypothetical protein [Mucilaginibacter lappiensis]MBB6110347.1 antitoxin component HigA of HigAB toxin-antitoxin module [Mucilaginibacter lappiensis]SIR31161.1 hypothetical protein SAMN05421821_106155 [Mucilaginibacter lappiensis]